MLSPVGETTLRAEQEVSFTASYCTITGNKGFIGTREEQQILRVEWTRVKTGLLVFTVHACFKESGHWCDAMYQLSLQQADSNP